MLSLYAIASAGMAAQRPVGRRAVLGAAMSPAIAPALAPARAAGPAYTIERVIPLAELTGGIASSRVRNIVITGANSGVGLAGAKQLAAAGHRVVCACRTQAKADAAAAAALDAASAAPTRPGGTAVGAECDLADMRSIRQFATRMAKRGPIDTLVLNAGVAMNQADKAPRRTADGCARRLRCRNACSSMKALARRAARRRMTLRRRCSPRRRFELTIGTNHLGHFLLANLLLTAVAASPSPRIVVTASPVHDPASGGGDVGAPATLGALKGLSAGPGFDMVDGGPYDADKARTATTYLRHYCTDIPHEYYFALTYSTRRRRTRIRSCATCSSPPRRRGAGRSPASASTPSHRD